MANSGHDNLIRAEDLTSEELRERAQKGGKASGEARREKKRLREAVEAYLSGKVMLDDGTEVDRYTKAAGLLFEELESKTGNRVGAFNALRDIIGEKPKDEVNVGAQDGVSGIRINFVDKSGVRKGEERDPKIVGEYTPPVNVKE